MKRYKCEQYDGHFSVIEVDKDYNISTLDKEIFADDLRQAIIKFIEYTF
jgi:hypothetical protein